MTSAVDIEGISHAASERILIAEDEPRIALFLEKGLRAEGYQISHITRGTDVVEAVRQVLPDLLLLDLGLPGCDGLVLLDQLRRDGFHKPVIVITARVELNDRIAGLDGGANDYVCKPFRFAELLARIRAHLRSARINAEFTVQPACEWLVSPDLSIRLNLQTREVLVEESSLPVELTSRDFLLLEMFLRNPGKVLSREHILRGVWEYAHDPGTNIVEVYIRYLRRKIGSTRIETIRGAGYRLIR